MRGRIAGRTRAILGQSSIEYTLLIGACSVPLAYGIWYMFFHPRGPGFQPRIVEFLGRVVDFIMW
jgi:hypothetical protein